MDRRDVSDPKIRLNGRDLSPYVCALFGGLTALLIGSRRESRQIPLSCDLVKQDLSDDEVFHPAGVILGGRCRGNDAPDGLRLRPQRRGKKGRR